MDLLDFVWKGEQLESSTVRDMANKPAYFVLDSMSVQNLLTEFQIRKVHMAVVINGYGGTVVKSLMKMIQRRRSRRKLAIL
ncbi:hypothetical protein SLE2022_337060 [Rubroshorea leprosula]